MQKFNVLPRKLRPFCYQGFYHTVSLMDKFSAKYGRGPPEQKKGESKRHTVSLMDKFSAKYGRGPPEPETPVVTHRRLRSKRPVADTTPAKTANTNENDTCKDRMKPDEEQKNDVVQKGEEQKNDVVQKGESKRAKLEPVQAEKKEEQELKDQLAELQDKLRNVQQASKTPGTGTLELQTTPEPAGKPDGGGAPRQLSLVEHMKGGEMNASSTQIPLPEGITKRAFSNAERARLWAAYCRTQKPGAGVRDTRSEKCPDHVMAAMVGMQEKQFYFQIWLSNSESWGRVLAFEEHYLLQVKGTKKTEAWLTEYEMLSVFGDPDVVSAMKSWCVEQTGEPKVRLHPRIPHCIKAQQYSVVIEDHLREKVDRAMKQGISLAAESGGEMVKAMVRKELQNTTAAFGTGSTQASIPFGRKLSLEDGQVNHVETEQSQAEPSGSETPAERRKREALERIEKQEKEKEARKQQRDAERDAAKLKRETEKEAEREQAKARAQTVEGRAEAWLKGLVDHINRSEKEAKYCASVECALPANLAKEYVAMWTSRVMKFKKARTSIEQQMGGVGVPDTDFNKTVTEAEASIKSLKGDLQRFATLERSYKKQKDKDQNKTVTIDEGKGEDDDHNEDGKPAAKKQKVT